MPPPRDQTFHIPQETPFQISFHAALLRTRSCCTWYYLQDVIEQNCSNARITQNGVLGINFAADHGTSMELL